jgi:hypothetical protein
MSARKEPSKRVYTEAEKKYIRSKVTSSIAWESISESLRLFWLDYRDKNERPKEDDIKPTWL